MESGPVYARGSEGQRRSPADRGRGRRTTQSVAGDGAPKRCRRPRTIGRRRPTSDPSPCPRTAALGSAGRRNTAAGGRQRIRFRRDQRRTCWWKTLKPFAAWRCPAREASRVAIAIVGAASRVDRRITELSVRLDRFRVPPAELADSLPQQLVMLMAAADAVDDAGGLIRPAHDWCIHRPRTRPQHDQLSLSLVAAAGVARRGRAAVDGQSRHGLVGIDRRQQGRPGVRSWRAVVHAVQRGDFGAGLGTGGAGH